MTLALKPQLAQFAIPGWKESDRLAALEDYQILDTAYEKEFDAIVKLAAQICNAPVSLISLVDKDRQWFKAVSGFNETETTLDKSICSHAILQDDLLIINDTTKDPRTDTNPLVTGEPHARFYAGAVLRTTEGYPLGTLCVLDDKPRTLSEDQTFALQTLANTVMSQIELRRNANHQQEAEQHFRQLADAIPQLVWVTNPKGRINYFNRRWYDYTGLPYNGQEYDSTSLLVHPDDLERSANIWLEHLANGQDCEMQYRYKHYSGEYRWQLMRAIPIRDKSNNITNWFGTATDIQDLVNAVDKAEHANSAKTEFLANMSHEIRTPMNAVIGLSNILAKTQPLTQKQTDFIKTLQTSADSLLTLINDLLDISKIEARNIELESVPFSITETVQEVVSMMAIRAQEKKIEFTATSATSGLQNRKFLGDPARLRQIILNLCSNAIKFTDKGGVEIILSSTPSDNPDIEDVCIAIKDTGIGIPEDKIGTIFQKFAQADSSINRRYGGTGLGLAITEMLTSIMGGEIKVESVIGKGSTFTICLPLQIESTSKQQNAGYWSDAVKLEEKSLPETKSKILLVEDYAANVLVATTFLEQFGYDCEVASNGLEAIEKAKRGNIDLILMDVQMNGLNGLEATTYIRENEKNNQSPRIPIIGMTAHAFSGDRERCIAAGMDDYVPKPFNPDELRTKIRQFLDK